MTENQSSPDLSALSGHFQQTLPGKCLALQRLPLVPEIRLWLVDASSMHEPLSHAEAQAVVAEPAYWSFCWASGQALARWILDNPATVRGRTVLDVGTGSGVVAIAAALAGAREVLACDTDPAALLAAKCNATANSVTLTFAGMLPDPLLADVICAADILYDRDNLAILPLLAASATCVLLADSRVRNLQAVDYLPVTRIEAITWPDLDELKEFRQVNLYRSERISPVALDHL
jgi:predicted nicotinamide N-methyase